MLTRLKIMIGDTCWPGVYCYKLIMADDYRPPGYQLVSYPFLYFSVTWVLPATSTFNVIQCFSSSTFT
jgi:hypothetical protein